jgi:hypothetical protein
VDPILLIVYVVSVTLVLSLLFPRLREADAATRRRLWLFTIAGFAVFLLFLFLVAGPARGRDGPAAAADGRERVPAGHVVVCGEVPEPLEVPLSALPTLARVTVEGTLHDGREATFEGVRTRELLIRAGLPRHLEGRVERRSISLA